MICVSFSSAGDVLFNDEKIYRTLIRLQGTENQPFRFLGDTCYNLKFVNELIIL